MEILELPSWEEIESCLRSDLLREFKVDIETDSTIQAEQAQDQERMTSLLTGIMNFMDGMVPAVEKGIIPIEAGKKILLSAVRKFKMGREVEDSLEQIGQGTPPDDGKAQEQQVKQAEAQAKIQAIQLQQQGAQQEAQFKAAEHQAKMQELQAKQQFAVEKHKADMAKLHAQALVDQQKQQAQRRVNE